MEGGGNTVVNLMFEAKEVTGKPQLTSNVGTRKVFANAKYMNKTFFDTEKALFRESGTAPTLEKQEAKEDDDWLDFDDLFPSPKNRTTKSLSPKRNHSDDEVDDAAFPADFPAFPDFDDSKADLGLSKFDLGLSQSMHHCLETTTPIRRRSLHHDSTFLDDEDASRPTVANTKPRRNTMVGLPTLQPNPLRSNERRNSIDVGSSSKQHTIAMEMSKPARISGQKSRSFNEAQRRRRSLDNNFSPFTGKLAEEDPDIKAVARSRSLDDDFPIFDADDEFSSFPMPLAKKEKEEGLSKSSTRRQHSNDRGSSKPSSRRALSPLSVATAVTTGRRSRSLDSDFPLFDVEELPTRPRSPMRNSVNAELSKSLHPGFKVSPKRQSSKEKPLVFGEAQLPTRSRSPMRNSVDTELSQSLHPSFKVSTKKRSSKENDPSANPTFSHATAANVLTRSSDGFLSPTKPQSLRVSMARRQAKMEDFASGWNSNVSLSEVDMPDAPQLMQSSQSGFSRWKPNISPVAEESTVSSFTHVADELSASVRSNPSAPRIMKPWSLSDLSASQSSQPNPAANNKQRVTIITRGVARTRSLPPSPIVKIESARLKVRKNEEILASLMNSKNASMPDNSLGKKLEVDLNSEQMEKRKFTLFPNKQKSPELADKKAVDSTVTDGTKGKDGSRQKKDLKNEMLHRGDEEKGDSSNRQNRKKPANRLRRSRDEGGSSNSKDGNGSGKSNAKEDRGRASSSNRKKVSPDNE
jgi:hypothetical protein